MCGMRTPLLVVAVLLAACRSHGPSDEVSHPIRSDAATLEDFLKVSPTTADFGRVACGTERHLVWTAQNIGNGATGVPVVEVVGAGFSVGLNGCTGPIPPGAACMVDVVFRTSSSPGPASGTLLVQAKPGGTMTAALAATALPCGGCAGCSLPSKCNGPRDPCSCPCLS